MARMSKRELLELIAQAEREGWRELDLSNTGLTDPDCRYYQSRFLTIMEEIE